MPHLVHVAPEQLVVLLQALHKALGRYDARLPLLGLDLHQSESNVTIWRTVNKCEKLHVLEASL